MSLDESLHLQEDFLKKLEDFLWWILIPERNIYADKSPAEQTEGAECCRQTDEEVDALLILSKTPQVIHQNVIELHTEAGCCF